MWGSESKPADLQWRNNLQDVPRQERLSRTLLDFRRCEGALRNRAQDLVAEARIGHNEVLAGEAHESGRRDGLKHAAGARGVTGQHRPHGAKPEGKTVDLHQPGSDGRHRGGRCR